MTTKNRAFSQNYFRRHFIFVLSSFKCMLYVCCLCIICEIVRIVTFLSPPRHRRGPRCAAWRPESTCTAPSSLKPHIHSLGGGGQTQLARVGPNSQGWGLAGQGGVHPSEQGSTPHIPPKDTMKLLWIPFLDAKAFVMPPQLCKLSCCRPKTYRTTEPMHVRKCIYF